MMIELLFQGLTLGGLYGMIGVGLALSFGILRVVNLAQGELITIGAFLAVGMISLFPALPLALVLAGAFLGCAALGVAMQALAVERAMAFRDPMVAMLVTFGLAVILRNALVESVGANLRGLDIGGLGQARVTFGGLSLGLLPLLTLGIALLSFGGLALLIFRTRFGRQVRALSDRPEIAELMGIRIRRVHAQVAALSAGLAALAGVLLAMRASVSPFSGVAHLLIAFEVVVLGGIGSIRGALGAGLLLGMTQVVSARFDGNAGLLYVHLVFFVILVLRAISGRLS
ncbi:branched-chain amino acid ABC transporter permease [Phaeobacter sp. HF9A]|uniref:branched-chain amino acid ABC transporter permease n=1 Tax=Phaeobacter sp. HF9A TaxID=2721561 RepID=UPI001C3759A9|nr:branched-chain amino acid ABC transporter permease [Phaeobacter sp. HF9A]